MRTPVALRGISVNQLREFWAREFASKGACCLCGGPGVLDTRGKVFTTQGVDVGAEVFCICPIGRALEREYPNGPDTVKWMKK
jgi:hypothetical protein